jgi:hypothetical protein
MSRIAAKAAFAVCVLTLLGAAHSAALAQGRYGGYPPKYCVRAYDGAMECFYFDLQQCRAAASGTGGDCAINPRFVGYPDPRAPRWKRAHR